MKVKTELVKFKEGIELVSGSKLSMFELMVETYGELNEEKSNGILVCHAFSGNHHAAGISENEDTLIHESKMVIDLNKTRMSVKSGMKHSMSSKGFS